MLIGFFQIDKLIFYGASDVLICFSHLLVKHFEIICYIDTQNQRLLKIFFASLFNKIFFYTSNIFQSNVGIALNFYT